MPLDRDTYNYYLKKGTKLLHNRLDSDLKRNGEEHKYEENLKPLINSTHLFKELYIKKSISYLSKELMVHTGTIKRWLENFKVPENYYNDLNRLLNYKYPKVLNYREKDQFYTKGEIAQNCYDKAIEVLRNLEFNIKEYAFIEPSAGCCNFYNLLPKDKRIGIDIEPKENTEIVKKDYLSFSPNGDGKYIVIGNPPFGLRGNLALRFINHSYNFADAVCFILPQLFNSDGKGVPKKRVLGYKLAYSEDLPINSFQYPNGKEVNIATIFQIWVKKNTHLIKEETKDTCKSFLKIYSLSNGGTPSSTRNKDMIGNCDVYLPSTTFKKIECVLDYRLLPHNRGYGVVFLKEREKLKKIFMSINWNKIAFLSTNSALNLRTSLIEQEIIKRGFIDEFKLFG